MKNLPIIITVAILILLAICMPDREKFSMSGLSISDRECSKLTDVYYHPQNNDPKCRSEYLKRFCGKGRRQTIEPRMGNYFMDYGVLV